MRKFYYYLSECIILCTLFGCQQAELADPNDTGAVKMKTVTISAGVDGADTKASLDSQTGAFTWQSGDLISFLATDGKFYDFILKGEYGVKTAEFEGTIPETAAVTTVATYPRIVANGTENTVLTGNTLNYVLPATWNYAKDVSNVPMVATFGEGADHLSFKQVGGVMRFPVKNLPADAKFVVTMHDKTITGEFPVDIATLGESCMTAGTAASELVINYTSDVDGKDAEFNVPVPTGVYNNFTVTIKDAEGNELFTKNYSADNKVERATLLNMKELVLPERPMVISEVWPFFVDARVVFGKYEGIEKYAFYVDNATEPVIIAAEDLGDKYGALVGGQFAHNSTHTVAVAKVVDNTPVAASKSAPATFSTAQIYQLKKNTGTKFVSVGWDDVAIGVENSTQYDPTTQLWTRIQDWEKCGADRFYHVQLLDENDTPIYDFIPVSGYNYWTAPFSSSKWTAKVNGKNALLPPALSFGWLEPGKDYYFRVKTIDKTMLGIEQGNHYPGVEGVDDIPAYSRRGGSAWSNKFKVTTDEVTPIEGNLIFHEGFDDIMLNDDFMNWSCAVLPDLSNKRMSNDDYMATLPTKYPEFVASSPSPQNSKWICFDQDDTWNRAQAWGLFENTYVNPETARVLNSAAGSLKGWSVFSAKEGASLLPGFGLIKLGEKYSGSAEVKLVSPAITSDKLFDDVGTKATIKVMVAFSASRGLPKYLNPALTIQSLRNDKIQSNETYIVSELDPERWEKEVSSVNIDNSNCARIHNYFEITHELYLRNGDVLVFKREGSPRLDGALIIGDIKIEIVPGEYEGNITNPYDTGFGTEPDDTNYDAFGLGEFPITYWYTVEPSFYIKDGQYDYELTKQRHQEIKEAGINIVTYFGHSIDRSFTEQKRILDICEELGLKFFGSCSYGGPSSAESAAQTIALIKEHLASSPAYLGDLLADEPGASKFASLGVYVDEFRRQIPDKDVYINLYPITANSTTQLVAESYDAYIDQYLSKVNTKTLSYDIYPLGQTALNTKFFTNLDLVRSKTLAKRKPFWVITQAGAVISSKMPNEKEERWSVWSNIAGGSKGISYFCYWTPDLATYDDAPQMIDRSGNKTDMYYWVKQINSDINTIGKKLLPCHADGVILTTVKNYPLYENMGNGRSHYGPVKGIKAKEAHLMCGCFRDARRAMSGDNYKGYKVLLTHELPGLNLTGNFTASVQLDPVVSEITVTHCNTTKTVQVSNTLNEQISENVTVSYDGAYFVVSMPEGEAVLLEF